MASTLQDVKNAIKTTLDTLTTATLKEVIISDIRKDPLDHEIAEYPVAFIMPPAMETSDRLDNRTVARIYTFVIQVYMQAEDISGTSDVEDLIETIIDILDNNITLGGKAIGGVQPITTAPEPFQHNNGKDLIVFDVIIKAKALETLTF